MSAFHLKNENEEFTTRANDIYACLDDIKCNMNTDVGRDLKRKSTSDLAKYEPGYITEPNKWTKYSLEGTSITNDRQNTHAALNFFHKILKQKKTNKQVEKSNVEYSNDSEDALRIHKNNFSFKKPSVVLIHEHSVGVSISKPSKVNTISKDSRKSPEPSFNKVELTHLDENTTSIDYQVSIEAKLDETITLLKPSALIVNENTSDLFKIPKVNKSNRNIRKRDLDDNS